MLTTDTARAHAKVATARAACSALELETIVVGASDRVARARGVLGNRIFVSEFALVATLASLRGTTVSATRPALAASEEIPVVVLATKIPFRLADISTTLTVATRKRNFVAVPAHGHAPLIEELRKVPLGWSHGHERAVFVHALTVRATLRLSMC